MGEAKLFGELTMRLLSIFILVALVVVSCSANEIAINFEGVVSEVEECCDDRKSFFVVESDDDATRATITSLSKVTLQQWQPLIKQEVFSWLNFARLSSVGKGPNVIDGSTNSNVQWQYLQEITFDNELVDALPQLAIDSVTTNGKVYGIPYSVEAQLIYYNKRLVNELPTGVAQLLFKVQQGEYTIAISTAFEQFLPFIDPCASQSDLTVALGNVDSLIRLRGSHTKETFEAGQTSFYSSTSKSIQQLRSALGDDLAYFRVGTFTPSYTRALFQNKAQFTHSGLDFANFVSSAGSAHEFATTGVLPVRSDILGVDEQLRAFALAGNLLDGSKIQQFASILNALGTSASTSSAILQAVQARCQ